MKALDYYTLNGRHPVRARSRDEWVAWAGQGRGRIARDVLPDGAEVSTVFQGMDPEGNQPPLLFATRVFDGPMDGAERRYRTWRQAAAGHPRMVRAALLAAEGAGGPRDA
jgi:hypothetical protein